MNHKLFLIELGQKYLPIIPDVHARLQADPPARIANIGCGPGWSSIGIARSYPKARVDGFDRDEQAIESAWANAHDCGLIDRLTFHVRNPGDSVLNGRYDLVTAFAAIHELGNPVAVLHTMRRLAGETGIVIVLDGLPPELAEEQSSATTDTGMHLGMDTDTLLRYAQEAGFAAVERLPADHFYCYRLYP
jgi:trans-aconitate methyltransferase